MKYNSASCAICAKRGAKFGEVILELDNGAIAKLRVTPKQTTLEVTDADGREIKAPVSDGPLAIETEEAPKSPKEPA